jgi:hypothetical protein
MHMFSIFLRKATPLSLLFLLLAMHVSAQNIITEGFEGTFPPAGWTRATISQGVSWTQIGTGNYSPTPHGGAKQAYYDDYNSQYGEALLVTPAIPLQTFSNGFGQVSLWFYNTNAGNEASYPTEGINVYANTTPNKNGTPALLGTLYNYSSTPGWFQHKFSIPTSYNGAPVYIIFDAISQYGWYDSNIDDVSVDYIGPCVAPTTAPASIAFNTATVGSISGTITPATGSDGTLVVRTTGTTPVGATPINATTYAVGSTFGNGVVVSAGPATTFTDAGLASVQQYTYTAFAMNGVCAGGPLYYNTPLVTSATSIANPYITVPVSGFR